MSCGVAIEETVCPGNHASNGAAETTMKVIRRHANLWIQQVEEGCVITHYINGFFFTVVGCTIVLLCAKATRPMKYVPTYHTLHVWHFLVSVHLDSSTCLQKVSQHGQKAYATMFISLLLLEVLRCLSQGALDVSQNRGTCKWWAKLRHHRGSLDMLHLEHNSFCQNESLRLPFCRCHLQGHEALMLKL